MIKLVLVSPNPLIRPAITSTVMRFKARLQSPDVSMLAGKSTESGAMDVDDPQQVVLMMTSQHTLQVWCPV